MAEQGQKRRESEILSVLDEYLERMRLDQHPLPGVVDASSRIVLEVLYSTPHGRGASRFTGLRSLDSSDFALPQFSSPYLASA